MSDEYRQFVRNVFDRYKRKQPTDLLYQIPIYDPASILVGYLRPIIQDYRLCDPHLGEILSAWRAANPTLGTGTFEVTTERTLKWLDHHILGREDRLLFLVQAIDGTLVGHLGFSNFEFAERAAEIDAVVRGVKGGYPGMMGLAMQALIAWGKREIQLRTVKLSVYSDNEESIRFYEKNGFKPSYRKALYKVILPDEVKLEVAPEGYTGPIEKYYLYMEHRPNG